MYNNSALIIRTDTHDTTLTEAAKSVDIKTLKLCLDSSGWALGVVTWLSFRILMPIFPESPIWLEYGIYLKAHRDP